MVEQGDIIQVSEIGFPLVVVSKSNYNQSGNAVVCPITSQNSSDLGYHLESKRVEGYVLCDNIRMLQLKNRSFTVKGAVRMIDLMNILSRVSSIFDLV